MNRTCIKADSCAVLVIVCILQPRSPDGIYLLQYVALIVGFAASLFCGVVLNRPFAANRAMRLLLLTTAAVWRLLAPAVGTARLRIAHPLRAFCVDTTKVLCILLFFTQQFVE